MFRRTDTVQIPVAPPAPPTIEDTYNGASGDTAYATSIFSDAIAVLEEANDSFDNVEIRSTSEIDSVRAELEAKVDRLVRLRDDAVRQRRKNLETISNLRALLGASIPE